MKRNEKGQMVAHVPTKPNREQVKMLVAVGVSHERIAKYFGIDKKTLEKHYRDEIDNASLEANLNVANAIYKKALKGDMTACIWWSKNRMNWRDKPEPGEEDVPAPVQVTVNVTDASVPRANA